MTDLEKAKARILELESMVDWMAARIDELQAPFLRHAACHDLGAPLRFSVQESRRIVGMLRGEE